jgi:hypothetical protein
MTVEELQRMYVDVIGRETGSSSKAYLQWKIREAEKGRIHRAQQRDEHKHDGVGACGDKRGADEPFRAPRL